MEEINVQNILAWLTTQVKEKRFLDAHQWVDTAQKLNILLGEEHDKLFDLQQRVAEQKVLLIKSDKSVSEAKTTIEATDLYKEMSKQKALIGRVEEMIRIAKTQARLKDNEYRNQ